MYHQTASIQWRCSTSKNIGAESLARNARLGDVRQGGGRISPLKIKVQLRYADHKFVEEQVDWLLGHDEGHVAVFLNVVGAPKTLGFPVQHHHYWKIWGISTVWETHMLHPNACDINSKMLLRSTACRTLEAWKRCGMVRQKPHEYSSKLSSITKMECWTPDTSINIHRHP